MFKELCRLCGNRNDETLDIFSEIGSNQKLKLKINEVVRLNIVEEDPLPKIVCILCIKHLENASYFIDHCHQTQTYLSQLYQDSILPHQITSAFDTLSNVEKPIDEQIITEHKDTVSKSASFNDLVSTTIENSIPIENCNRSISENHNDGSTDQNYIELTNASSIRLPNDSAPSISTRKCEDDTFNSTKIISNDVITNDKDVNNISPCDTRSSIDNSQNTTTQNTTNDRSQLKRKCTSQTVTISQDISSDESNHEQDDQSDDSNGFDSYDDEYYELSSQKVKNTAQKSKSISTSNKKNAKKDINTKNSTLEQSPSTAISKTNTKENTRESKDKKRFTCATCKKSFSQELTYQEHLNVHSGKRPFSCKLCTASFRRRQELNQHLRTVHSEKQFKCPSCDHVAKHKGKLTEHIKSVHDKPFACDMCNYRTGEKGKIMQHIANKHTADLSYVCEICGNGFKTKSSLQVHIRNIHFPEPKVCQICGTVCPSLARYSSHIFRCGKEKKRYPCEKCGRTYVNKEILKDHMNKHLNVKPYKCDVCGKEFFQRNRLDTHKYVHRGANYQCEICNQSFNRKDNMKNHMKRHFYKSMRYDNMIVTAV